MRYLFTTRSPEETEQLAARLGSRLTGGEVIAFTGGMGMGKTAFTRGLARGLGICEPVVSPTFALVNEYVGRLKLEHFDMYRVETWDDLDSTGFFEAMTPGTVLAVEWSENIENALPENCIRVQIVPGEAPDTRLITIEGWKGEALC